jgi:hypothetical protein
VIDLARATRDGLRSTLAPDALATLDAGILALESGNVPSREFRRLLHDLTKNLPSAAALHLN